MNPAKLRRILPFVLFALTLVATYATARAQTSSQMNVFETIKDGGPLIWMVWLAIVGTSMTMVTFIIQNIVLLKKTKLAPPPVVTALELAIAAGNYQEAYEICKRNNNYVANVLKAGLTRVGRGREAVEAACAEHGLREATVLRSRNSYLSVIGVVSPMIGLLGTVIGMMGAFTLLGEMGMNNPRELSAKIGEVLLATASGLFIAIPAFVSYYIFRNNSQMCIVYADDVVNTLLLDIPYDELAGVQIGENFSAGRKAAVAEARKVSVALTTACPACHGAVTPGVTPCPHCSAPLDWQG
jgi:biopolymer transport protein ExbB